MQEARPKWFLSFDCATVTLAFSLSRIDFSIAQVQSLRRRANAAEELLRRAATDGALLPQVEALVRALDVEVGSLIQIVDGETVNLCPGMVDANIPTVTRIRALVQYVNARVKPALLTHLRGEKLRVLVEYQAYDPQRKISDALVTLFAEEDVIIIGAALKNRIYTCEEGKYSRFAAKYASSYTANKAHAKFNFRKIEDTFGSTIPPSKPALRGHIADSFMQVLGHLMNTDTDEEARNRY